MGREQDAVGSAALGESPEGAREDEELDNQRLKELAGFVVRAPRRHPLVAALTFFAVLSLGVLIAAFWPRSYVSQMRILAQHNLVLPALDNPNRAVPREADSPTKNAADTIMKRDNIVALMKELDIIDRWQATRQPILRFKDKIWLSAFGAKPEDERFLDLIGLIEKKLTVQTDDSTINVSIEWPDRQMAFDIMSLVQKNFLEARYDTNVSVIEEAIRILEERAQPQSKEVDVALEELSKLEAERRGTAVVVPSSVSSSASSSAPRAPSPAPSASAKAVAAPLDVDAANDAAAQLEDVRRRVRELDEGRRRHLAEAENQLADARATLGPLHPTVVALNEKISQLSTPDPELAKLKAKEHELVARVAKGLEAPATSGSAERPSAPAAPAYDPPAPRRTTERSTSSAALTERDDPATAFARSKLQAASAKYNELLSRIEAAHIELDVTRAAFKYQYTIVKPPELARKPSKPNLALVLIAALVLSLLFMVVVPAAIDLSRGRFVEPWQVERELKLPVLGELMLPPPQ